MSSHASTRINAGTSSYSATKSSYVDSRNLYAPKSSRFPGRKASRNVLASRSFTPGSPWALGIVMTPRRKASGSNLALGITIVEIRLIDWFIAISR